MQRLQVVDSHTGGEPTRIIVAGGPDLGAGPLAARRDRFQRDFDRYRSAVVNEPRGSDVLVGALLVEPEDSSCAAGVIFFNNVGYIGMCGHGTIGLVVTLAHLGRIRPGEHRIETPVGVVSATLLTDVSSADAISAALCGRADGSFSRQRVTSAASVGGTSGRSDSTGAGISVRCATSVRCGDRPGNGGWRVSSSYAMHPNEYRSAR